MPKPAPYNYSQQQKPYVAAPKPSGLLFEEKKTIFSIPHFLAINKPSFNTNKPGIPGSGSRINKKGSALLNRNDNTNQIARCYTCGINIR
jgi:hypothetical protein